MNELILTFTVIVPIIVLHVSYLRLANREEALLEVLRLVDQYNPSPDMSSDKYVKAYHTIGPKVKEVLSKYDIS